MHKFLLITRLWKTPACRNVDVYKIFAEDGDFKGGESD